MNTLVEINKIINIFVDYNQKGYFMPYVYAIGKKENLQTTYENCYIGVTDDLDTRWKGHVHSKYRVGKYIRKHKLTRENMVIVCETDKDSCFEIEKLLRPKPSMGLNEAVGGHGGYTSYGEKRNKKISKKLKGRAFSEVHKKNLSKAKKGLTAGEKNAKAKKWKLLSPDGLEYNLNGNLCQMCEELNLLPSTLRYYRNNPVPEISIGKMGGFRAKSEKSKGLRMNTTGWTLIEESSDSGGM